MKIAHYCMDNPEHIFRGNNLDGIRCPWCDGLINIKSVSREEYNKLPDYHSICKPINQKKFLGDYDISVDFDSTKFAQKLRVIAKHAEALANELDAIDNQDDELPTIFEGSE